MFLQLVYSVFRATEVYTCQQWLGLGRADQVRTESKARGGGHNPVYRDTCGYHRLRPPLRSPSGTPVPCSRPSVRHFERCLEATTIVAARRNEQSREACRSKVSRLLRTLTRDSRRRRRRCLSRL